MLLVSPATYVAATLFLSFMGLIFMVISHVPLTGLFKAWDQEPAPAGSASASENASAQ